MGTFSVWHWMLVLVVVLLLFGSGKISSLMGDFAKGIKSFKKNMAEDESMEATAHDRPVSTISPPDAPTTTATTASTPRETTRAL